MAHYRRRDFLRDASAAAAWSLLGCPILSRALPDGAVRGRVVVGGGGFGGATCAKYLKQLAPLLQVTLVEPNKEYITCPLSNAVIGGLRPLTSLAQDYRRLAERLGVELIHDTATAIDAPRRTLTLKRGGKLHYDRLEIAPGIALKWGSPEGYDERASELMPHAWKAGPQTELLRRQLEAMRAGGVVAISVPPAPFRCPPGPYERASLIAGYLQRHKARAKVLILDANEKFSKQALFTAAWRSLYPGMIEWIPISGDGAVRRVDPTAMTLYTESERHRVAVANVIPVQSSAAIAVDADLTDSSGWCPVDPHTFESRRQPKVHVIGDACSAEPMPKSASGANSQAKVCALAIVAYLAGKAPAEASLHNTCYSLAGADYGLSISAIYQVRDSGISAVVGAGGVSPEQATTEFRAREARYALGWYDSIVADTFG
jgi:sulfide dehydrogenase [flavocytochrome c] flavoprotein subunit